MRGDFQRRSGARAAGLRSDAVQVGENPVDRSGLGNEGDDAHLMGLHRRGAAPDWVGAIRAD